MNAVYQDFFATIEETRQLYFCLPN